MFVTPIPAGRDWIKTDILAVFACHQVSFWWHAFGRIAKVLDVARAARRTRDMGGRNAEYISLRKITSSRGKYS